MSHPDLHIWAAAAFWLPAALGASSVWSFPTSSSLSVPPEELQSESSRGTSWPASGFILHFCFSFIGKAHSCRHVHNECSPFLSDWFSELLELVGQTCNQLHQMFRDAVQYFALPILQIILFNKQPKTLTTHWTRNWIKRVMQVLNNWLCWSAFYKICK